MSASAVLPDLLAAVPPALLKAPFTTAMAAEAGLTRYQLHDLVVTGLLRHPMRGIYVPAGLPDTLESRVACLRLTIPAGFVVTDRTAGWLWGAPMILAPGDHLVTPRVSAYGTPGRRLRNDLCHSGERTLARRDVHELDGLVVTTPLRTACDLGRLLHRDQALGALDALVRSGGLTVEELCVEAARFRGYRGVRQLRTLAPIVDGRAQSPGESVLRLRWYDTGLPRPECQVEVEAPDGGVFAVDLGLPEEKFGAEYDGAAYHGDDRRGHDDSRRAWITRPGQWLLVVARSDDVHGRQQTIHARLAEGYRLRGMRSGLL